MQVRAARHWRIHVNSYSRRSITRPEFMQTKFQMQCIAEYETEFLWRGIYVLFYGFRSLGVSEPRDRARTNLKTLSSPHILVKCSNVQYLHHPLFADLAVSEVGYRRCRYVAPLSMISEYRANDVALGLNPSQLKGRNLEVTKG